MRNLRSLFLLVMGMTFFSVIAHAQPQETITVVERLSSKVNTEHPESGPRLSPDGQVLYFFRVDHPDNLEGTNDIWYSRSINDTGWSTARHFEYPLNVYGDNSVHDISGSGDTLLLHNEYQKNKTMKNGLSYTYRKGRREWAFPEDIKIKKYRHNPDAMCAFAWSKDQEVLIMAIEQDGSFGKQDLYISFKEKPGKYSEPRNLGKKINTRREEATPFISDDGKKLYFSSRGHGGMGGYDVFVCKRQDSTWQRWSEPQNIGEPYNSKGDEFYYYTQDGGETVYLASDRMENDNADIYKIIKRLPPELDLSLTVLDEDAESELNSKITIEQIDPATNESKTVYADSASKINEQLRSGYKYKVKVQSQGYVDSVKTYDLTDMKEDKKKDEKLVMQRAMTTITGKFYDKETNEPIEAKISFKRVDSKDHDTSEVHSEVGSEFEVILPNGHKYHYHAVAKAKDYMDVNLHTLDLRDVNVNKQKEIEIFMERLGPGDSVDLENVFFETDKATLLPESYDALDVVARTMNEHSDIKVEISGHTDNRGPADYNQRLSERRAQSVVDYLVDQGINRDRLEVKGYGESKPVASNDTKEGMQKNRRVVFKIIEIDKSN